MRVFAIHCLLGCSWLSANEALDLLASDLPGTGQVYLDAADPPKASTGETKKAIVPPDRMLPDRWELEAPALVTFGDSMTTRFSPRGLFEYQYHDSGIARQAKLRRARLGVDLATSYGLEFRADALFSSSGEYEGLETLKLRLPVCDDYHVTLGKLPPEFSTEYTQDASVRWFPTLSPLVAQIAPASSLGAVLDGTYGNLEWKAAWFSSDSSRDIPQIEGDGYFYASVSSSLNGSGGEELVTPGFQRWHLDYIYNMDADDSESIPLGYRHLVATGVQMSTGPLDFYADFLLADGSEQTAWGVTAAAAYWLAEDAVRLVARYHYAKSRQDGGILAGWGIPGTGTGSQSPYGYPETRYGGELHAIFGGLNFHLFEDNLVIGTGAEYRALAEVIGEGDINSWAWNTWARFAF